MGCAPTVARDGASALELAAELPFDYALLDIGLSGMDGYELARGLREQRPHGLRLLAVTGYQDRARQRTHEAGFDFHLVKPVTVERLRIALDPD